jgi:hypothetical protein
MSRSVIDIRMYCGGLGCRNLKSMLLNAFNPQVVFIKIHSMNSNKNNPC